jgi:hypothetical protein
MVRAAECHVDMQPSRAGAAIHALAPTCRNCGIVGHGLEKDGVFFCCEHCAEAAGVRGLRDRIAAA